MEHVAVSAGVAVAALFPIMDPIGVVPWFVASTRRWTGEERRAAAAKAAVWSVVIMVVFLFFGRFVLDFFEISLAAIEFVGGLVIAYVGWEMLIGDAGKEPEPGSVEAAAGTEPAADREEIYFSPLAFPLLAGPGALAVTVGLSNRHDNSLDYVGFVLGILAATFLCYLIVAYADRVLERLGPKGVDVLNRIFGLLVLAIAAELVFHGISDHFGLQTFE